MKNKTEQCFCPSYYDDINILHDCACGKRGDRKVKEKSMNLLFIPNEAIKPSWEEQLKFDEFNHSQGRCCYPVMAMCSAEEHRIKNLIRQTIKEERKQAIREISCDDEFCKIPVEQAVKEERERILKIIEKGWTGDELIEEIKNNYVQF